MFPRTFCLELDIFNDLIFDLGLLCCSCFMFHAVLLAKVSSQAGLIMMSNQITNVEKSACSAGIPQVQEHHAELANIHSESKKLCHYTFVHNFDKCWPIFKILSLLFLREICKTDTTLPTTP